MRRAATVELSYPIALRKRFRLDMVSRSGHALDFRTVGSFEDGDSQRTREDPGIVVPVVKPVVPPGMGSVPDVHSMDVSGEMIAEPVAEPVDTWELRFAELVAWKEKTGNCLVPKSTGSLGRWASRQREIRKRGELAEKRIQMLESIDFIWDGE